MTLLQNLQQQLNGNKLFLFLFLFLHIQVFAQQSEFEIGVNYFNERKFSEAVKVLEKFLSKETEYSETANLIVALSYFELKNFEKAKNFIQRFEIRYPKSKSLLKILETKLAIALIEKNSLDIFTTIFQLDQLRIDKNKINQFTGIFYSTLPYFDKIQIEAFEKNLTNPVLKFSYHRAYLLKSIDELNSNLIKKHYDELIKLNSQYDLISIRKIGVIIPASAKNVSVEKSIINGLKVAIHKFNNENEKKLELKILTGDEKFLEKALIELAKDPEVLCVVGPLYSNQFKKLAVLADKLNIPLISPTATAIDISIKSKFIFQFNPTLDVRGAAMVKFAIDRLNSTRIGILSCDNPTYKPVVNEIRKRIKSSKSDLVIDLSWNENKKSLPSIIRQIRKEALKRDLVLRFNPLMDFETEQKLIAFGLTQEKIDSLKNIEAEVSIFEIFGKDAEKICKAGKISYFKRTYSVLDDLSVPVYSLDALLVIISNPNLIPDITNEMQKQNLVTKIIGNDIWNSPDDLVRGYPSSDGVYFTSDYFLDTDSKLIKNLSQETEILLGSQLNRNFFYGFETLNKILVNYNEQINRENFYEILLNDKNYDGLSSDIILNEKGVNNSVYILEYKNRKIKKIDRIITN
ncbi:MAG: ABC transporter substrate-binding protein [Ignavibacteria bacterium]